MKIAKTFSLEEHAFIPFLSECAKKNANPRNIIEQLMLEWVKKQKKPLGENLIKCIDCETIYNSDNYDDCPTCYSKMKERQERRKQAEDLLKSYRQEHGELIEKIASRRNTIVRLKDEGRHDDANRIIEDMKILDKRIDFIKSEFERLNKLLGSYNEI